jgi:hypothetical protein
MDLLTGCLIIFFQAGFGQWSNRFTRARTDANDGMNLMVFLVVRRGYLSRRFRAPVRGVRDSASLARARHLNSEFIIPGTRRKLRMKGSG